MGKSLLQPGTKIEKSGRIPEGMYVLQLDDIVLKEQVVSLPNIDSIPKDFMKSVRGKEKSELKEEEINKIMALDLGTKGVWEKGPNAGEPKPRFQNRTVFIYHEVATNIKFSHFFFGGPKLTNELSQFIEQVTGEKIDDHVNKDWLELIKPGDKFNAFIKLGGDFNNIEISTVRKVGLPPLEESGSAPVGASGFTPMEETLLAYLEGPGAGMPTSDIGKLHQKGVTINGVTLNDFPVIVTAFNGIKAKVKSYEEDGKIKIVRS